LNPCGEPGHGRLLRSGGADGKKPPRTSPAIAIALGDPAGLDPHAGEQGLFEKQETPESAPAVGHAEHEGLLTRGPLAPEAIFSRAWERESGIVVATYHD